VLPSEQIDHTHLTVDQQAELLQLLDKYAACFADTAGHCDNVTHRIVVDDAFVPKRLRAYRVPELLKPEVDKQIQSMLEQGIIQPSQSPMTSPLVCIRKRPDKDGNRGVRLAADYRYVNRHTRNDAYPIPDLASIFRRVGKANFISVADCKAGYWQLPVAEKIGGSQLLYVMLVFSSLNESHLE